MSQPTPHPEPRLGGPTYFEAVEFAKKAHKGQKRKLGGEPFILHPLAVAAFLAGYFPERDLILAAILHDVVEDTDVSLTEIAEQFGQNVAQLVDGVSEQDKSLPWAERKHRYFKRLTTSSEDVVRISAADKYHNLYDILKFYRQRGDEIFNHFNAGKAQTMAKYRKLINFYQSRGIPWAADLAAMIDEIEA